MKKLGYEKALEIYGDYMKYNNKFVMLENGECEMLYLDDNNYIVVRKNVYYKMKEVIFSNESKITDKLLRELYDKYGKFIIKVNMQGKKLDFEVVGEELVNESPYLFEQGSDIACMTTEKLIYLVKY